MEQKIDSLSLHIVLKELDYFLYYGDQPVYTPAGVPVSHPDPRLLEHMLRELQLAQEIDVKELNSYSLYSTQKDFVEQGHDVIAADIRSALSSDPVLHRSAGPEQVYQMKEWKPLITFLNENGQSLPVFSSRLPASFLEVIDRTYGSLPPEKRGAVINLANRGYGILLPLMLMIGRCSVTEFASGVQAAHGVHSAIFEPDWAQDKEARGHIEATARVVNEYLDHCVSDADIISLIHRGETDRCEFKSLLRGTTPEAREKHFLEHECLLTITAFLNTDGGVLIIGLKDDGEIIGIDADGFPNHDKFEIHFWNIFNSAVGTNFAQYVNPRLAHIKGKYVFVLNCLKSPSAVYLQYRAFSKEEVEFYVRAGNSSIKLTVKQAVEYISSHFGAN